MNLQVGAKLVQRETGVTVQVTEIFSVDGYPSLEIVRLVSESGVKYSCIKEDVQKNWRRERRNDERTNPVY